MFRATRQQAIPHPCRVEPGFVGPTRFSRPLAPFPEVVVYLLLVAELVPDHCVDVCQPEGGILLRDLLCCCPFAKCGDHRIQRNACASDTHDAIPVGHKRNRFGRNHQRHEALPHDPAQRSEPTHLEEIILTLAT